MRVCMCAKIRLTVSTMFNKYGLLEYCTAGPSQVKDTGLRQVGTLKENELGVLPKLFYLIFPKTSVRSTSNKLPLQQYS